MTLKSYEKWWIGRYVYIMQYAYIKMYSIVVYNV